MALKNFTKNKQTIGNDLLLCIKVHGHLIGSSHHDYRTDMYVPRCVV